MYTSNVSMSGSIGSALPINKWVEWKSIGTMVFKVDKIESGALAILYDNSIRMGNESNYNVEVATVNPDKYFDDICDDILNYVSYIAKSPSFQMTSYEGGKLISRQFSCDNITFDTLNDFKNFLKEKGNFNTLVLFSIVKFVNLTNLEVKFGVRYKEVSDPQKVRDDKIDYLTKSE